MHGQRDEKVEIRRQPPLCLSFRAFYARISAHVHNEEGVGNGAGDNNHNNLVKRYK